MACHEAIVYSAVDVAGLLGDLRVPTSQIHHLLSCFRYDITTIHWVRTPIPAYTEYPTHRQRLEMSLWLNGALGESLCRMRMARLTTRWWLSAQRAKQPGAGAARCVRGVGYLKVARIVAS